MRVEVVGGVPGVAYVMLSPQWSNQPFQNSMHISGPFG